MSVRDRREFYFTFGKNGRGADAETMFRIVFELIKGEMLYVKDLENIENVSPTANPILS
jgi:hypothetical protein